MTYQKDCTLATEILEAITAEGLENLPELIRILVNEAMKLEREQHLGAEAYERTETRQGYANGYKPKTVKTRVGEIEFAIPQVREGNFYPGALEKGLRSERALTLALAEMYVQGVSFPRSACSEASVSVSSCVGDSTWLFSGTSGNGKPPLYCTRCVGAKSCLFSANIR